MKLPPPLSAPWRRAPPGSPPPPQCTDPRRGPRLKDKYKTKKKLGETPSSSPIYLNSDRKIYIH